MKIPDGPNGFPTVSPSQLRTYGAGGFALDEQEDAKGCPRLYKAKYVDDTVVEEKSYALTYGSFFHDVLFRMEEDGLTPDEALAAAFPANGTPEMFAEAQADLTKYLERGASPIDRFGTLSVENELTALLYEDEDHGPIYIRGFIDWLGIDSDQPNTIRVVDYKTNRFPPSVDDVKGDVQLKTYDFLVRNNAHLFGMDASKINVAVHLDAIKWREVEVWYSDDDIDAWHSWAVAVVRQILRDETAEPVINPGCGYCPIKDSCPAFQSLPDTAQAMIGALENLPDDEARLRWRDTANAVRLLLEKAVKRIDDDFKTRADKRGILTVGGDEWVKETDWKTVYDLRALHRAMGGDFYSVVNAVKGRIESVTKDYDTHAIASVNAAIERVPDGTTVKRRKVSSGE